MMMTSPNFLNTQRKMRRSRMPRVLVVLVVLLICVVVIYWRNAVASVLWRVSTPIVALRDHATQNTVGTLQAELASTTAALADRNSLYAQNAELKRLLGRVTTSQEVVGAVLMRPPGLPYDTLMIDVGAQQGIAVDDLVFAGGSVAIGEVTDIYDTTSRVTLLSAPGRSYDAQILSSATLGSVVPVSLEGQGAGSFTGEVPAGSAVSAGDSIVIPGIDNSFMGTISHVDAPAGSSFETIYVQLPADIFSLQYVEVQTHK
jgi:cell shape-determining protein MreC